MGPKIFPKPKKMEMTGEAFTVPEVVTVSLPEELNTLADILHETLKGKNTVSVSKDEEAAVRFLRDETLGDEAYGIVVSGDGVRISYRTRQGAYYGLVTLGQILRQCGGTVPGCDISDEPSLAVRGYMLDISRGKVASLDDLCEYVDRLAGMKYNQLQLYVEGFSFAYPSFTEVWKDKMPITGEEIRYLDAYCKAHGIELVPNQNSLGHMSAWIAREEYKDLAEADRGMEFMGKAVPVSTLDAMDPRSLDLVTAMMDDMIPFFSSDKFNVNLDEPFELGKGKNKALTEEKGEEYLYMDYLKRLHERVTARGKQMYMWGDILANHPEKFSELPEGITVLDWGYEAFSPFEEHAAKLQEEKVPFILCPGTSTWTTLTGRTDNMKENIRNAAKAAIAHEGEGILLTAWGDGGHLEYELLNDGPIAYASAYMWGDLDVAEEAVTDYLNQFVYRDRANELSQILLDLGRLYHYEEFPMVNMTIASMNLMMGILPEGVFPNALEQGIRGIQALAPSAKGMIDAILAQKKDFDYAGAMEAIRALESRLEKAALSGDKAELLKAEVLNIFRIAKFAQNVHYLNAKGMSMSAEEKAGVKADIRALGREIQAIHPGLWIARNRIHGMEDSIAGIQNIMRQLEA